MSKIEYRLDDGKVFRGDQVVATYDEASKTLDFMPDCARFRAVVVRKLRGAGHEVIGEAGHQPAAKAPATNPVREPDPEPETKENFQPQVEDQIQLPPDPVRNAEGKVQVEGFEDGPWVDPMAGDKDPVFVDWLYDTYPQKAAARYVGRVTVRS